MLNQPTTTTEDLATERARLEARKAEMFATLEGCDWCCGGGDQELDEIEQRLAEIAAALAG
jgi:hypothetical protein